MSMTGKERAALRAEAHHLNVQVHVGHQGLTPTLLQSVDDVLRTHLLVKLQVAKAGELSAKEAAQQWTATFNPRPITADDFEEIYGEVLG